jgi:eukaryotic-like serine/threonine-protein kinase
MQPRARPKELIGARFRVEHELGSGGMGTVYRARDEKTGASVALKLFETRNATEVKRAYQEVQLLARLDHPAIVAHVADGITNDGHIYLAMQWIDGSTLHNRLAWGRMAIDDVVALARRLASALATAHEAGVVHRDVKPSNVLLRDDRADGAVLIDFGIARVAAAELRLTRTGTTVGTPGYMSPEQARGLKIVRPASDVFSLGCVLYECVAGHAPYVGASLAATLAKIVFYDPDPVSTHRPDCPEGLASLIAAMMQRDLSRRIPDGRALAAALDEVDLEPPPLPAPPERPSWLAMSVHCMVIASNVREHPPSDEALAALRELARQSGADFEVLENNHVCMHMAGERKLTVHRAASLALAMRPILVDWIISVSSETANAAAAVDTSSALLTRSSLAAVFHKVPANAIVVDAQTRVDLDPVFDLEARPEYELFELRGAKTNA